MEEIAQTVLAHHRKLYPNVTENKLPTKDKMNTSNNNIYDVKCHIKFFYVVPVEMESP